MYMSEHPLTPYMNEIRRVVTHFSSNLGEAAHEEKVRVAGMVTGIRPHQTKTGKMMAWVTLEDLTGMIELVLFPRTWEKFQFALEVGGVILAEGKVDAQSNPSKVLVDNIRTEIKLTEPAAGGPHQMALQPQRSAPNGKAGAESAQPGSNPKRMPAESAQPRAIATVPGSPADGGGPASSEAEAYEPFDAPPLPEDPPDWENDFPVNSPARMQTPVLRAQDQPEEPGAPSSDQPTAGENLPGEAPGANPSGYAAVESSTRARGYAGGHPGRAENPGGNEILRPGRGACAPDADGDPAPVGRPAA